MPRRWKGLGVWGARRAGLPPAGQRLRGLRAEAVFLASFTWLVILVATPFVAAHRVGGRPGAVVAAAVYAASGVVCHQRADRSFHPWGVRMPVCARCVGLYGAAPVGAALAIAVARRKTRGMPVAPRGVRWGLAVAALPTLGTWVVEALGLAAPSGLVRAGAAAPLGAAVAWVLTGLLAREIE